MSAGQKPGRLSRADAPRDSSLQSTDAKVLVGTHALDGTSDSDAVSAAENNSKRSLTTFVRVAAALLLLTSAGFKTYAIFTEPYFADSILGSPLWMVGLVECEILLGLWLLSGVALRLAWHVALAAFIGFAGVNIYLLATGATTCGCFGTVETHPWVMLGIDLAVLAALFIWRPKWQASTSSATVTATSGVFKHIAIVSGLSAVMLGIIAAWLVLSYGSLQAGVMAMRGEVISIEPATFDVGEGSLHETRSLTFTVQNLSNRPVEVAGGTTSCKCVATQDLPVIIPPKSATAITVRIRFSGDVGRFRQHFELWTDSDQQPRVLGRISGAIVSTNDS